MHSEVYYHGYTLIYMWDRDGLFTAVESHGKTMCVSYNIHYCIYYIRKKNHVRRWNRYSL